MPFIKINSNNYLTNCAFFKSLQGTDGNDKVLSSLEYYFKTSLIPLQHAR